MVKQLSFCSPAIGLSESPPLAEVTTLWRYTLEELSRVMTRATFHGLLSDSKPAQFDNGTLTVSVSSDRSAAWLNLKHKETVARTLTSLAGVPIQVAFTPLPPSQTTLPEIGLETNPVQNSPAPQPTTTAKAAQPPQATTASDTADPLTQLETATHYFRLQWRPLLGPLLSEMIRELRQIGHEQNQTQSSEVVVEIAQGELAARLGVSRSTIARALMRDNQDNFKNPYLQYFITHVAVLTYRDRKGRVQKGKTRFTIQLNDSQIPRQ